MKRLFCFLLTCLILTAPVMAAEERKGFYDVPAEDAVIRAADPKAGEGVVIAVIDSGFDVEHPAFTLPEGAKTALTEDDLAVLTAKTSVARRAEREKKTGWVSDKIVFAYDYYDDDFDVSTTSEHGTHVAASAAGSTAGGYDLAGAAPGAQLILMKIFPDGEGSGNLDRFSARAVRDAVTLGAQIINMSYGGTGDGEMDETVRALREAAAAGVVCFSSNGNNAAISFGFSERDGLPYAENPEYGTVFSPADMDSVVSVAAAVNTIAYRLALRTGEWEFYYNLAVEHADRLDELEDLTLEPVIVPGLGAEEDYADVDVAGKLAVIMRGEITFGEKAANAEAHGAAAVLFLNAEGREDIAGVSLGDSEVGIPAVFLNSYEDTVNFLANHGGTVEFSSRRVALEEETPYAPASFSSWDAAPSRMLRPDVSFIGTSVVSALVNGWSLSQNGSSMSSPQAAGLAAVLLNEYPDFFASRVGVARTDAMRQLMAAIARPVRNGNGLLYSPRRQGAGVISGKTPIAPRALIWAEGAGDRRLTSVSLGDGIVDGFTFDFIVSNLTDGALTLRPSLEMTTDGAYVTDEGVIYNYGVPVALECETGFYSVVSGAKGEAFTLPPYEEIRLTASVTLDREALDKRAAELFPNGFFVDGYVLLTNEEGGELEGAFPFTGFRGDWSAAPALDGLDLDGYVSYWMGQNLMAASGDGYYYLGYDYATELQRSDLLAFSPDGDGSFEEVLLTLMPLRAIDTLRVEVFAENGRRVFAVEDTEYARTSYNADEDGPDYYAIPLWNGTDGINEYFTWDDGRYTVRLTAIAVAGGESSVEFPVVVDTVRPTISVTDNGDGTYTATAADNFRVDNLIAFLPNPDYDPDDEESEKNLLLVETEPGAGTVVFSVPAGADHVYLIADDYAGNRRIVRFEP